LALNSLVEPAPQTPMILRMALTKHVCCRHHDRAKIYPRKVSHAAPRMKFSYAILPDKRLSILRFRGSVTIPELKSAAEEFWADRRYDPSFDGIADLNGVTTRVKLEDLRLLLHFLENRRKAAGRWAVVFSDPKPMALGLIFKAAFNGTFKIEIVSSWEAACSWLNVDAPAGSIRK
jgi:hypothetical protein